MKKRVYFGTQYDWHYEVEPERKRIESFHNHLFGCFRAKNLDSPWGEGQISKNMKVNWYAYDAKGTILDFLRFKRSLLSSGYNMDISHKGIWYIADPSIPKGDLE